jgi:hypothetical protein
MSIEIASWGLFAAYALLTLTSYYASIGKGDLSTLLPLAIAWIIKTAAFAAFAIYFSAWGILAIILLDIFVIIGTSIHLKKAKEEVNGNK